MMDTIASAWCTRRAASEGRPLTATAPRKVIEFVLAHPQQYDPEFNTTFERLVAKLDPPPKAG